MSPNVFKPAYFPWLTLFNKILYVYIGSMLSDPMSFADGLRANNDPMRAGATRSQRRANVQPISDAALDGSRVPDLDQRLIHGNVGYMLLNQRRRHTLDEMSRQSGHRSGDAKRSLEDICRRYRVHVEDNLQMGVHKQLPLFYEAMCRIKARVKRRLTSLARGRRDSGLRKPLSRHPKSNK
jgi:hypothetical protein